MKASMKLACLIAISACSGPAAPGRSAPVPATPPTAAPGGSVLPNATPADVEFMTGMHVHHAQAVLMGGWAVDSIHDAGPGVRSLGERIIVGQRDEMATMERWLRAHGAAAPAHHDGRLMPGMLNAAQLAQLDAARGFEFDRLFLTFMIQHHQGAVTMVDTLLSIPGGAQDGRVYRFAADIHADQRVEIRRMRRMLTTLISRGERP